MQIPILSGIYTNEDADIRVSYPKKLIPVVNETNFSAGYLRPADGIVEHGTSSNGIDRGGINWNGVCYRVFGSKLVKINENGSNELIGDVGDNGKLVSMYYSFDYPMNDLQGLSVGSHQLGIVFAFGDERPLIQHKSMLPLEQQPLRIDMSTDQIDITRFRKVQHLEDKLSKRLFMDTS